MQGGDWVKGKVRREGHSGEWGVTGHSGEESEE